MNNIYKKNFLIILFFTFIFSISVAISSVQAQISDFGDIDIIFLEISPENPRPQELVRASIESFSIDLDRASQITWLINGIVIDRGVGVKEVTFNVGNLGSRSVVEVIVQSIERGAINKSVTIRPTEVDLLWQADSYTPPLYKGKALPSSDAEITAIAIPQFINSNGRKLKISELIFTWEKDGKILNRESGRGKDTIKIRGPKTFRQTVIRAYVSSADSALQGRGYALISPVSPKIIFYENDPILGIKYEKAIINIFNLLNKEVMITAHPYFFSSQERTNSDFDYSWKVDGSKVSSSPDDESSIVLRQAGKGEGAAKIAFSIQNVNKILQSAQSSFSVIFGGAREDIPFNF
ncbi:hypothetical protein COT82_01290 [Candidatus Campbellbacteria bacterium CG10_big_fil_rev_8_21_14_0_10_35_52]|uniref:Uncharacterized protein n=1 Tax=Candidatus Campbellbacteria bacterium CG10_big_fil_rev_8_21_14_0_10_35_52 TaxID=1974527 RepID=A0A2M6WVR4_9BACT|nr:MAG: hypothetical protein COT82_01290 [Candidatus Campbellbacteria bacterium CG10_big_fil_rev_8_21_14_0_10_35_52]